MNHKPKILIVDDEIAVATMIPTALSDEGYEVSVVYDGAQAVRKAGAENRDSDHLF